MPNDDKKSLRATKWQVVGTIIVAAIPGLFASFHSMCSIQNTAKDSDMKSMVNQLNNIVIPAIQKIVEEIRLDSKQYKDEISDLREDVAYIKGSLESSRLIKPVKKTKSWGLETAFKITKDKLENKKKSRIPTLKMQYQTMGPSLESAIREENE